MAKKPKIPRILKNIHREKITWWLQHCVDHPETTEEYIVAIKKIMDLNRIAGIGNWKTIIELRSLDVARMSILLENDVDLTYYQNVDEISIIIDTAKRALFARSAAADFPGETSSQKPRRL